MMDRLYEWFFWLLAVVLILVVGAILYGAWVNATSPTFELRKDQWECTEYRDYTTLVMSGKVLVPIQHHECQQWERVQ